MFRQTMPVLFSISKRVGRIALLGGFSVALQVTVHSNETLQLEKALPLEGYELLQPSGLVMASGSLYMVSCQHDDQVFKITPGTDKATFQEHVRITRPEDAAGLKFVWRGIANDEDGRLLLLSETAYRVMRLTKDGSGDWIGPSVLDAGTEAGLFGGDHSGPDGIASIGKNKILVGASRDPRGLITVDMRGKSVTLTSQKFAKKETVLKNDNIFAQLMDTTRYASLGEITNCLYRVGGQYRRSM